MKEYMNTYEIIAKFKTPVYIGAGDGRTLSKQDYFIENTANKIYVVDINKLLKRDKKVLSKYEDYIANHHKTNKTFNQWLNDDMKMFLNADLIKNEYTLYTVDIGDVGGIRDGSKLRVGNESKDNANNISTFIKNSYREPYIPGSSIKGSLRTIVLKSLLFNETNESIKNTNLSNIKDTSENTRYSKSKDIEVRYFNKLKRNIENEKNAVNDLFSYISISDSEAIDINSLVLCEKTDIDRNGKEKKLNVVRECLKPGTEIKFNLTIYKEDAVYNIEQIIDMITKQSVNYLKYFNTHFNFDISNHNGIYMPIGGGVGYISKTIVEEASSDGNGAYYISQILDKMFRNKGHYKDYKNGFAPRLEKSTKYAGFNQLMGLLEIKKVFEPKTSKTIWQTYDF